jgi:hypothetical protein
MSHFDYLLKEYQERIEQLTAALSRNQVSSYEEYKYVCGQIRGLEAACGLIEDLKKRLENSDYE